MCFCNLGNIFGNQLVIHSLLLLHQHYIFKSQVNLQLIYHSLYYLFIITITIMLIYEINNWNLLYLYTRVCNFHDGD